jgi:hypothetical protein
MEIASIRPGILSKRSLRSERKVNKVQIIKQLEEELIKKNNAIVSKGTLFR